jgi:hypothetical protein
MNTVLLVISVTVGHAQHFCWPCAQRHASIGKETHAATQAPACYDWYFTYLNSIQVDNKGHGSHEFNISAGNHSFTNVLESWDVAPNVLSIENNEAGTLIGDLSGKLQPLTPGEQRLVEEGLRLETGLLHQEPCVLQGRAHIINGTLDASLRNFTRFESKWGLEYTSNVSAYDDYFNRVQKMAMSPEEAKHFSKTNTFGLHNAAALFHSSGPCTLQQVEQGVSQLWANNFSQGYHALFDNNVMLWTTSLGSLLSAFLRDDVEFYPMRWSWPGMGEVFSVLASPCGKHLIEVASLDTGGTPSGHFHYMPQARAVFRHWNAPINSTVQPLVPLRISRAVGEQHLNKTLAFYGYGGSLHDNGNASALGFHGHVLADERGSDGTRAVTLLLSPSARVHLQLWSRPEIPPATGPTFPRDDAFTAAANSNQVNGGQPANAKDFCLHGTWTVQRYVAYTLKVHETVMSPIPSNFDAMAPPAGKRMDVFIDDHFSWDCTDPSCNMANVTAALHHFGVRAKWVGSPGHYFPYTFDPSGYGLQLHWFFAPKGFRPAGSESDFQLFGTQANGTCPGSFRQGVEVIVV